MCGFAGLACLRGGVFDSEECGPGWLQSRARQSSIACLGKYVDSPISAALTALFSLSFLHSVGVPQCPGMLYGCLQSILMLGHRTIIVYNSKTIKNLAIIIRLNSSIKFKITNLFLVL